MNVPRPSRSGVAVWSVIALSTVAHLWELGLRPMAHDEAIDAWFSWQARGLRAIEYDPVYQAVIHIDPK